MGNYFGERLPDGSCRVLYEGEPLNPRLDLVNHSPTGFQWGYNGSGPAQLALAILANEISDKEALEIYQTFKAYIVSNLEDKWWLNSSQIHNFIRWYREKNEAGKTGNCTP